MIVPSYTFRQIKELLPDLHDNAIYKLIAENKVKRWTPNQYENQNVRNGYLYDKFHIDYIVNPNITLPAGISFKSNGDIKPRQYKLGEKVSFWDGRNKFNGMVVEVKRDNVYKVYSVGIGRFELEWFLLGRP